MFKHISSNNLPALQDITCAITGKRVYLTPSGKQYPSMTTILSSLSKDSIEKWRAKKGEAIADKITKDASENGRDLHTVCEQYLKNDPNALRGIFPTISLLFASIKPYLKRIDNIVGLEQALFSDQLRIAGKTDLIAEFDGILSIGDFKHNSSEYYSLHPAKIEKYWLQTNGYRHMYEHMTGIKINRAVLLVGSVYQNAQLLINDNLSKYDDQLFSLIDTFYKEHGHEYPNS